MKQAAQGCATVCRQLQLPINLIHGHIMPAIATATGMHGPCLLAAQAVRRTSREIVGYSTKAHLDGAVVAAVLILGTIIQVGTKDIQGLILTVQLRVQPTRRSLLRIATEISHFVEIVVSRILT